MAIKNEIETLVSVMSPLLPGARFARQTPIKTPTANDVQIEALGQTLGNTETHYTYAIERTFRIVIYGSNGLDVLTKAEAVGEALSNAMKIQINAEPGYMTLGSFNLSETFETSTAGVHAIIGLLSATVRKARPQTQYDKILNVSADITTKGDGN